jgi:hypothetical protein
MLRLLISRRQFSCSAMCRVPDATMVRLLISRRLLSCSAVCRVPADGVTAATTTVPCTRIENIVPQRDFSEIIDVRKD